MSCLSVVLSVGFFTSVFIPVCLQNSAKTSVKERLGFPVKPAIPTEKVGEVFDLYPTFYNNTTMYTNRSQNVAVVNRLVFICCRSFPLPKG